MHTPPVVSLRTVNFDPICIVFFLLNEFLVLWVDELLLALIFFLNHYVQCCGRYFNDKIYHYENI
jgi:hypothetical protein